MEMHNPSNTELMGVVNVTPDSFSDGGRFFDASAAIEHGLRLVEDGADYIDVGGESTRPGAEPLSVEAELMRVLPVIEGLAKNPQVPISIDTYKAEVARAALDAGASVVNDISALRFDAEMAPLIAERGCPVVIMHMKGNPRNMQDKPYYEDTIGEIKGFLEERADYAISNGIRKENIWIDPGIGFGKRRGKPIDDNLDILHNLERFCNSGHKVVLGTSRKAFIGAILGGVSPEKRLFGSLATFAWAAICGVDILRVHDVAATRQMLDVLAEIVNYKDDYKPAVVG
ncbi:dihydropteroate synthase [bacterium]|nr:MAG: dihydropteroate synthase [bacterium]